MNDSNFNSVDRCNDSVVFVRSTAIKVALVLEILIGSLSFLGNGLLIAAVWCVSIFHSNLRWLLINLSFNLFWYAGATVLKALHFLVITCMGDPCLLAVNAFECKYWEMAYVTPFLNTIYSIMAVGIERLFSTFRYRTYENSKVPWIACVFIAAIWVGTLGNQVAVLSTLPRHLSTPICLSFLFAPVSAIRAALVTNTTIAAIGLAVISTLYAWNLRESDRAVNIAHRNRGYSLASRFAVIQNVNVNKLLLPSVIAHACAHMPYDVFVLLMLLGLGISLETKVLFMHCTYVWFVAYGTTHAWLAFSRHPQLRAKLESWAPRWLLKLSRIRQARKVENYNPSAVTSAHFDMLARLWSSKQVNGCVAPS